MSSKNRPKKRPDGKKKKTSIGNSVFSKCYSKGGGIAGSTKNKNYRKCYRGQGKSR